MASGFKKEPTKPELATEPIESAHIEEVAEPLESTPEPEQCEMSSLSDNVISNVLAVLGKSYDTQESAQLAVGGVGCTYFMHKSGKYNSLQLRQVEGGWSWIAI